MGITVTRTGSIPVSLWDQQAMDELATLSRSRVVLRVQEDGRGDTDAHLRGYSTRPLKLYYRTSTAKRLKPKGGAPFPWVRGPRTLGGGYDRRKIGQEGGRFYAGGYRSYKGQSRKGVQGAEVDLTLSGQMLRQFRVLRVSRYSAFIGFSGQARTYGPHTDAARPWIGLSPGDVRALQPELDRICGESAARSARGNAR